MADRIKNYQQEADQITTLKAIRTDLGVTPSSYTPDSTVVTKDRVVTFSQAEEELVALGDIEKGVKQQVVKGDIADKRISNIEKLLQGNLYDYQTDSSSAYTKSVPAGAMPYAGLEKVGGKTVAWNQLVDYTTISSGSQSGITITNNNDGSVTFNGIFSETTSVGVRAIYQDSVGAGHKLLIKGCPAGGDISTCRQNGNVAGDTTVYFADTGAGEIVTAPSGTPKISFSCTVSGNIGDSVNITFKPQLFDLTLIFGTGNEPSILAEFEQIYGADYYAHNAGSLLSAGVTSVVSNSKNLLLNATLQQGTITLQYDDGNSSANRVRTDYIAIKENTEYTASVLSTGSVQIFYIFYYNASKTGISYAELSSKNATVTTPANASYIRIVYYKSGNLAIVPSEVKDAYLSENPNKVVATYPIPAEVQALEGYGWSAGSVYNYIDFERKVFVKRVGRKIYDGTETWGAEYNYNFYSGTGRGIGNKIGSEKMVCSYCVCDASMNGTSTDTSKFPACFISESGNLNMLRADITHTGADMKAWCLAQYNAGTPLTVYYELATPVEIDISEYLTDDNLIQVEASGTLTFPNSNGDDYRLPVPSEEEYMIDLQSALGE